MNIRLVANAFMLFFALQITAQTLNQDISENEESPFLLGKVNKKGLTSEHYNIWFSKNYEDYNLDMTITENIKSTLKDYNITVFLGTWCGDSKREVPRFYKILEACDFPEEQLNVVALSRKPYMYKQSPNHEEAGLNIHRVPTFIFYKNRKEINRIVESPVETLEMDIENIITSNNYTSNYQIVSKVDDILKHDGLSGLKKKSKKLIKLFKGKTENMYELNTYGRILIGTNQYEEAIAVFRLNNQLFPEEPRSYMSLANTFGINGNTKEALSVIKKAIIRFPENTDLVENLETLKTKS